MKPKKIDAWLAVLMLLAPIGAPLVVHAQDNSAPQATPDESMRTGFSPMGVAIATSSPTGSGNTSNPENILTVDNGDGTTTTTTIITTTTKSEPARVTPGTGGTLSGNSNITYPATNSNIFHRPSVSASGNDHATTSGNQYAQQQQQLSPEDARVRAGHPAIYWILIVFVIIGGIYYAIESSSPRKL
jgi:hypothetical protein